MPDVRPDSTSTSVTQGPNGIATATLSTTTQTLVPAPAGDFSPPAYIKGAGEWIVFIMAVAGFCALVTRLMTKDVKRDVTELSHDLKNTMSKVAALEHYKSEEAVERAEMKKDIEHIVGLMGRIETGMKGMGESIEKRIDDWASAFDRSIREVRKVEPKD